MLSALFSALDDRRLAEAVILVRKIRARWPDGEFGTDEDEDVEVLLGALCRHRATVKPGGKTEADEKKNRSFEEWKGGWRQDHILKSGTISLTTP